MLGRFLATVVGSGLLLGAAYFAPAQKPDVKPRPLPNPTPIRYEAEDGLPKDKEAEKRRDYAVIEAALNDIASPDNPEHFHRVKNTGPGREILIHRETTTDLMILDLAAESPGHDVGERDRRRIPNDVLDDFRRRSREGVRSLADFKPANPNILLSDFDKQFRPGDFLNSFLKQYPKAWGYVWAHPPAYSKDGRTALALFEGGPNGEHGMTWVYVLTRNGKRWEVNWRHLHFFG